MCFITCQRRQNGEPNYEGSHSQFDKKDSKQPSAASSPVKEGKTVIQTMKDHTHNRTFIKESIHINNPQAIRYTHYSLYNHVLFVNLRAGIDNSIVANSIDPVTN